MNLYPALRRHRHTCPYRPFAPPPSETSAMGGDRTLAVVIRCECGWFLWVAA